MCSPIGVARVIGVNVGRAATVVAGGRGWRRAIGKRPVAVTPLGLDGDEQAGP